MIGPDSAGNLLEVIVLVLAEDWMIAIHAMKLRRNFYELLPGEEGSPVTDKTYTTKSGKTLTDADIEQLADEAATTDYDVEVLKSRRGQRRYTGTGILELWPQRPTRGT